MIVCLSLVCVEWTDHTFRYTDGMPPQPQLHNSEQYPPQQNMQGYPQQQGMGQGQPQYVIQEERECNIELPGIHCC